MHGKEWRAIRGCQDPQLARAIPSRAGSTVGPEHCPFLPPRSIKTEEAQRNDKGKEFILRPGLACPTLPALLFILGRRHAVNIAQTCSFSCPNVIVKKLNRRRPHPLGKEKRPKLRDTAKQEYGARLATSKNGAKPSDMFQQRKFSQSGPTPFTARPQIRLECHQCSPPKTTPFPATPHSNKPLETLHCGKPSTTDGKTRYAWVYFLRSKSDGVKAIKNLPRRGGAQAPRTSYASERTVVANMSTLNWKSPSLRKGQSTCGFLDTGWMVLPVVCSNRRGGGERSIRLRACAYVGEAVPRTITEGVTVLDLLTATALRPTNPP